MNDKPRRILLDTNVVSELYKSQPDQAMVDWCENIDLDNTFISSITIMELIYGMWRMPAGRRRTLLSNAITHTLRSYERRMLPFDLDAGIRCSLIRADLDAHGHPVGLADTQIAAIAQANDCTLATRNTKDFQHTGVPLINPWEAAA